MTTELKVLVVVGIFMSLVVLMLVFSARRDDSYLKSCTLKGGEVIWTRDNHYCVRKGTIL